MWRSFSFRLTLTYLGLFLLSVMLLLSLVWYVGIYRSEAQIRSSVEREYRLLEQAYAADGQAALVSLLQQRAQRRAGRLAFHVFIDPQGRLITGNLPSYPRKHRGDWITIEADRYADGGEDDHLALARDRVFDNGARLIVGRDAEDIAELTENLTRSLLWVILGSLLLGGAVATIMSRAIGQRLERISGTALRVMDGDLSQRIPVTGSNDEFDGVSVTLNAMLARIQTSVAAVSRISDHVAHELRTPLTRLMGDVEQLQFSAKDGDEALVLRVAQEANRLNRIFDTVLRVARLEAGRHQLALAPVDLAVVAGEIVELYQAAAEAEGMDLTFAGSMSVAIEGDRDLLAQALANILDNAIKYGGSRSIINVSIEADNDVVRLSVRNSGSVFRTEELDRLTERFYRGAGSESCRGEGLGLSLVAAVVSAHAGDLAFRNDRDCAVVVMSFNARSDRP
jgi:signal transduction histidine kinase